MSELEADPFYAFDLFSCEDSEDLHHDVGEAIGEFVDGLSDQWILEHEKITVKAHKRQTLSKKGVPKMSAYILDCLLDSIDETGFGNPEDSTKPTEDMKALAEDFVGRVFDLYPVWTCDEVMEREFNLHEWLKDNEPERYKEVFGDVDED